MHLIIFSPILTPRIKYIFNFIFKDILKAEVEFTGNSQYFLRSEHVKISYGEKPLANELFFKITPLLLASKLEDFKPKTTEFADYQVPFPVKGSTLPFDVFAASFYILTRYEEYIFQKNTGNNFSAAKSLQLKWKILDRPIIDEWALILKNMIQKAHPNFRFHEKKFSHNPTINFTLLPSMPDGFLSRTKFLINSVLKKENDYLSAKFDRLTGLGIQNETVISSIEKEFDSHKNKLFYFISFPKVLDSYITKNGISSLLTKKPVGILSACVTDAPKPNDSKTDVLKLKKILPEQVTLASQQLDDLRFPFCYLNLLNSGITVDYSMGYNSTAGFRAGTCTPFSWYDLQLEKVTALIVKSYCISDAQFQFKTIEEAKQITHYYIDTVKMVNGFFYSSWQLRSVSDNFRYKKLKTIFSDMLINAGN